MLLSIRRKISKELVKDCCSLQSKFSPAKQGLEQYLMSRSKPSRSQGSIRTFKLSKRLAAVSAIIPVLQEGQIPSLFKKTRSKNLDGSRDNEHMQSHVLRCRTILFEYFVYVERDSFFLFFVPGFGVGLLCGKVSKTLLLNNRDNLLFCKYY